MSAPMLLTLVAGLAGLIATTPALADPPATIDVQLLSINDFHGNLEPPQGSSGMVGTVPAGGAEYLATHIATLRATNPDRTFVVSAGDLVGASPLVSRLFHDEPTIEAMNLIGLDYNAVGNHEFDDGVVELRRLQRGGCHPDGCAEGTTYEGADFRFLAANVVRGARQRTLFEGVGVEELPHGVKIAFIGMTLKGTDHIVDADGIRGWTFLDEADTVNALVPKLRRKGIEAIVVLIHQGGFPTGALNIDGCNELKGPIVDIVGRLDPAVDLVLSGHTHQAYNCRINGIPVSSAYSYGRLVTDVDLTIDVATGDVSDVKIDNTIVTRDVPKAPALTELVTRYDALAAPVANRQIGRITADLTRTPTDAGEQSMGDVVADAMLASTKTAGAQLAFINPGGIRTDLRHTGDGAVTYEAAFAVQPFGDTLVTLTLTGAQLHRLLEEQFCGINAPANGGFNRVLLPSANVRYTYHRSQRDTADCDAAHAVDESSITIDGVPISSTSSYRVTVNDYLVGGGDGFAVMREATNRVGGVVDLEALAAYFGATGPVSPPALNRITAVP